MNTLVGHVALVLRYPVKSTLGERVTAGEVTERGLAGDRTHAVLDSTTGRVASAKNPRLWQGLLAMSSRATDAAPGASVSITLRDGTVISSSDPSVDDVLSREFQRPVNLLAQRPAGATIERAVPEAVLDAGADAEVPLVEVTLGAQTPGATFVDYAPLHLITTGTLDRLGALSPNGEVEAARYRPNIVVETTATGFVENHWVDALLEIGDHVLLRVVLPTPRCAVPGLAHGALPRNPDAVRTPFQHNRLVALDEGDTGCAGVYAQVLQPGTIRHGDPVRLRGPSI